MKFSRFSLLLLCLVASSFAVTAQSMFMKVMDPSQIPGESVAANYQNWTEISAFNAGSTSEPSGFGGAGGGAGPTIPKCFTISMRQDRMAYYLKREMFLGGTLVSIQMDFTRSSGQGAEVLLYRVQMENVYVTAIEEATSGDGVVTMNVSFTPERFRYTYWPQSPTGSLGTPVTFGWNVTTNQTW